MIIIEPKFVELILDYCHKHSDDKELIDNAAINYNLILEDIKAMSLGQEYDYYNSVHRLVTFLSLSWESIIGNELRKTQDASYVLYLNKK